MAAGKYQKWRTPDGLLLLAAWARDGLSEEQIAKKIGVSRSTLSAWKVAYPDIQDALARGKEPVDVEVENALYKLATGYTVRLEKSIKLRRVYFDYEGRRCEKEEIAVGHEEMHVPANVNAQKFWLANRKPKQWRERLETSAQEDSELLQSLLDLERRASK